MNGEGTTRASEEGGPASEVRLTPPLAESEAWVADLRTSGARGAAAQEKLRALVAGAVRKATASHAPGGSSLDAATLEDLTQVALVKVLGNLERFEGRSRFSTWAWAVAVRAAFSELRRAAYRKGAELSESKAASLAAEAAPPENPAERRELVEILQRLIAETLTERQRTAILAELAGTPQEELLASLNVNRNALYKLVHDARQKLKRGLHAAGISDEQVRDAFDL